MHRTLFLKTTLYCILLVSLSAAMAGKALYTTAGWSSNPPPNRIYIVDLETGDVDSVYKNSMRTSVAMANFSPNGEEIGFIAYGNEYYAMKNNGSQIRKLFDMKGSKTKGGDWAWTDNGIFWVTHELDVYRGDPETGQTWLIHHIEKTNGTKSLSYANGLWASDDGRRVSVWCKESSYGILMDFEASWTSVTERWTDCWGHGNWMPGDGSAVVVGAWGGTRGELPQDHRNFVAYNWDDIAVNKAFLSGVDHNTSVYGLRWCANDRDLIGFETEEPGDYIINWRTEALEQVPLAASGLRTGDTQPDMGGFWSGALPDLGPAPPTIVIATEEVHWPQANGITRVYLSNGGGGTLDALSCEVIEGGEDWLNLLFTGPEYQIEPGNTQVIRVQLTSNTLPDSLYYATVMVYGGGAIDTGYFDVVYNKNMPVYVPGNLDAIYFGGVVELTWSDKSDNETAFLIERADSTGVFAEIARVDSNITTFRDTTLEIGGLYEYRLRAASDSGYSGYTKPFAIDVPIRPTVFVHNPEPGNIYNPGDTVHVLWDAIMVPIAQVMYSIDAGETWEEISVAGGISTENPLWGDLEWVVPDANTDDAMVWVRSYQEAEYGTQIGLFSIHPPSAVTLGAAGAATLQPTASWHTASRALSLVVPTGTRRVQLYDIAGRMVARLNAVGLQGEYRWQLPTGVSPQSMVVVFDGTRGRESVQVPAGR